MKETILTNKEKSNLEKTLQEYKTYRIKKLKYLATIIVIGSLIGGIPTYLKNENISANFIFELIGIIALMLIPLLIAFLASKKGINRLSSDLKSGKKIEGKSTVKSINIFNRKINLLNGVKVFEPNEYYKTFKKGDLIKYKISPSNEYIFECRKE
ncbi:hypothetical protein [uncultured Tenacibaculum sp.]|uniref:hypothetical protein n=1 Tax=uncultured Tenacibaculum sp. TaxID=174713 RepID=UPI0026352CC3|nr:hypothetical protein [uncultured Tenacibaculum sp.]